LKINEKGKKKKYLGGNVVPVREDEGGNGEEKKKQQLKKKTKGPNDEKGSSFLFVWCIVSFFNPFRFNLLRYFSLF
jgi:hypothetical protein